MPRIKGCQSTNHEKCSGELWTCSACPRTVCFEEGSDNDPDVCDDCWNKRHVVDSRYQCPNCKEPIETAVVVSKTFQHATFTYRDGKYEPVENTGKLMFDETYELQCPNCWTDLNSSPI